MMENTSDNSKVSMVIPIEDKLADMLGRRNSFVHSSDDFGVQEPTQETFYCGEDSNMTCSSRSLHNRNIGLTLLSNFSECGNAQGTKLPLCSRVQEFTDELLEGL